MHIKNNLISKTRGVYWVAQCLFFFTIIITLLITNIDDAKQIGSRAYMFWFAACCLFFAVNIVYLKVTNEKPKVGWQTKYQLLYALVLVIFALVFSVLPDLKFPTQQFIYLFLVILAALKCITALGIGTAVLLALVNVLTNHLSPQCIWLTVAFYVLIAWLIGNVSQINLRYAQQMEQKKQFLEDMIETFTIGILISDADGRITICNSEAEKILHLNRVDIIGRSERAMIKAMKLSNNASAWLREGYTNKEIVLNGKDYLVSRTKISKEEQHTITVINDITQLIAQNRQIETLKMFSAIGELSAAVAHEVRNPLTTIKGFMQLIENDLKATQYYPMSKMVVQELDKINRIISGLMQITVRKTAEFKALQLNEVINEVWDLYTCDGRSKGFKYTRLLSVPLPPIYGCSTQIQQVILNLLQNAEQARQKKTPIMIKTYINDYKEVCFDVIDRGKGIAPDVLEKITIPLYTEKFTGTGLGLPICEKIISEHNGFLDIASQQGKGTTVTVRFPPADTQYKP